MTPESGIRKVPGLNRKAPIKSLILFTAGSLRCLSPQSPAKSRKAQCLQGCKAPQGYDRKVHPYGGGPGVPPPMGSGHPLRCFGDWGKAEFHGSTAQRAPTDGIPYRPMSAGWL